MKKTLIALAVAGTFVAPAAFAASANVDFYGKFRVSVDNISGSGLPANTGGWQVNDEQSRIGFKGAEDLGGGLKAIYQYETGFNIGATGNSFGVGNSGSGTIAGANTTGGLGNQRDTFVGLSGDFGTALIGRHDTPYKMVGSADLFGDTLADAQNSTFRCIICEDLRVNNAVAYVSPSMSGLTLVGAIVPGNATTTATTKSLHGLADAYSLAAMYGNGPLSLGLGYENLNHVVGSAATGTTSGKQTAVKLNASYTIDALKLGGTYERLNKLGGVSGDKSNDYLLSAAYGMGPITLAAQYGYRNFNNQANTDGYTDMTDATVGVVYSLSKRTSTYVGYAHYKMKNNPVPANNGKINAVTLGLNHDF